MVNETPAPPLVCYRHPERETGLRCARCGHSICPECARSADVGYRCPECIHNLHRRYFTQGGYAHPLTAPRTQPRLTYGLMGLLVIIWLWQEFTGGSTNSEALVQQGAAFGPLIILRGEVWRLVTAMFLHIGLTHLLFNSFALFSLGQAVEAQFGYARFACIFLLAGYAGNLLGLAWRGPEEFSAGASGGVFGIMGAELGFLFFHRQALGQLGKQRQQQLAMTIVINLVIGFTLVNMNIDNLGHIGGLLSGVALGYFLAPRYVPALNQRGDNVYADQASLRKRWWLVVGAGLLLIVATLGVIAFWFAGLVLT